MNKKIGIYIRKKFHKKRWRQFAFMMACIVVFCTTYALLLPAVTLEKTAACGLEEHQHEESCYEDHLVCGQKESGEHRHSDICYQKALACGKEVHVHSADCFQDKFLEGAMDGDFLADYTGEDAGTSLLEAAADAGEETGTSLLEEKEDAGDTAVNEQAADSALDLEAEEAEETAGEAQTLSEEIAVGEVGSDEEHSAGEAEAAENQFSEEEGFEAGENLTEETEETVSGETGSVEENPAGETGSVKENSSEESETTQEQSSAEEAAAEAETLSEETLGETIGENAGATTEQTAPDEMAVKEAAPVQGVAADLACQGQDYEVTVTAGEEAGIPEGASLSVSEIMPETSADNTDTDNNTDIELTYEEYASRTEEALGLEKASDFNIRLFDIKIVDAYGEKIKIQAPVDVKIQLTDQEGSNVSNAQVVHFADETNETDIAEGTNGTEKTDTGALSEPAEKTSTTPSRNAAAGKAKKFKKAAKAKKEKKCDVIQDVTVEAGMLPEDGTSLSFVTEGFSVFAVVRTTIEKTVLASDGHNYKVTVTYGADTGIPITGTDLSVAEITTEENIASDISSEYGLSYEEYVAYTENALDMEQGSAGYIRLFDIKIVDQDDPEVKYQPAEGSKVDMKIELADVKSGSLSVVHFPDGKETPDVIDSAEVTDAEDNGRVIKIQTDGFSVYAIVDGDDSTPETKSIKYVFHYSDKSPYTFTNINGDTTDTQYVKDGETVIYIGTPIDDPNQEGKEFWGWYAGTLNGDAIEWGDEIEFDTPISVSETTTVNVYARYEQTYYVTYYDENGNVYSVVKHANGDTIRLDVTGTETLYTASNAQKAFLGWSTAVGTTEEIAEGSTLTVTGNISLYPAINDVKWINFNAGEIGNGASYTAPVYVLGNVVTSDKEPDNPTRRGYAFGGWYKDEACTQAFKWDGTETLTDDITLYAKWTEADTIYTVVIWKQNLDGTGYDYVESRTVDALTGSTASTSSADTGRNYTGFSYAASKSDTTATVLANGTTTLNVRYDRNPYALTFEVPGSGYIYTPSNSGTWGYIDGEYVQLDTQNTTSYVYSMPSYIETTSNSGTQYRIDNGRYTQIYYKGTGQNRGWYMNRTGNSWNYQYSNPYNGIRYTNAGNNVYIGTRYTRSGNAYTETTNDGTNLYGLDENGVYLSLTRTSQTTTSYSYNGEPYTGARFTRSDSYSYHTIKTITALYQQDISSEFPIVGTNGVTYNNGERWDPQSSTPYNEVLVFIDIMPAANVIFRLDTATRPLKTMNYYVEALPGTPGTATAPGTLYEITNNVRTSANGLDFVLYNSISARYNGVTPDEDFIDLVGFARIGADSAWSTRSGTKFYIYDTNNDGTVNFYYSRNSYNLEFRDSDNTSVLYDTKSVKYQAPVASEVISDPTPPDGYTFHGWYADPSCSTRVFFTEPTEAELAELKYDLNSAGRKTYKADGEYSDQYIVLETMPASNYVLYANWAPKRYQVNIDPNGGALLTDGSQSTYFNIDYGEKIGEYANVSRNYVKISEGQDVTGKTRYSYHYDSRTDNDGEHRWAYYYEDPNGDYIVDTTAYTFVGWYRVEDNGAGAVERAPFNFDTMIEEDTTLRAMWRREGVFKVKYTNIMNEGEDDEVASPNPIPGTDEYTYVDLAEAKVGSAVEPPENYVFAGWRVLGTQTPLYQPGDIFTIDSNFAEYEIDGTMFVTLEPVFVQIDDAYIQYDLNKPSDATALSTTLTDVDNNIQSLLKDNSSVELSSGDGFSVTGYRIIGWSDVAIDPMEHPITRNDDGSFEGDIPSGANVFKLDGTYGVSDGNILYAVWEPLMTSVSFIKEGEHGDGSFSLLAGAEFTLYADEDCTKVINSVYKSIQGDETIATSSGTADPGDGTNVTFPKVPVGTFYFKETSVDSAYGLDSTTVHTIVVTEDDDEDRTLTYTVDGEVIHTIKNYLKGTLAVSKTVVSELASDALKEFSFTVTLSDTTVNGMKGEMEFTDGIAVFTLKDGEEKKAKGLPNGISYTVEETAVNGFETTSTGANGTYDATASQLAQFTNTRKMVDVTVAKEVTDTSDTTVFPFTVTLKDGETLVTGLTIYRDTDDESKNLTTDESTGQAAFDLSHGTQKTLTVPAGIMMVISEDAGRYTAEVVSGSIEGTLEGKTYTVIVPLEGGTVTYKNTISAAKLRIHKTGDDAENGLAGAEFNLVRTESGDDFTDYDSILSMDDRDGAEYLGYLPSGDSEDSTLFTLPDGSYTLVEEEAPKYYDGLSGDVTITVNAGVITASATPDDESSVSLSEPDDNDVYTLTITNVKKTATVTTIKNVIGTDADKDAEYSFTATGLTELADTFSLHGRQIPEFVEEGNAPTQINTKVYTDIPYGTEFSITEADTYTDFDTDITAAYVDSEGNTQAITLDSERENKLSTGIIKVEGDVTITYTNKRNKQPVKVFKFETGTSPEKPLSDAVFSLTGPDGSNISYTDLTTNSDGYLVYDGDVILKLPVNSGAYTLTETQAPAGYQIIGDGNTAFTVSANQVIGAVAEEQLIDGEETPTRIFIIKVQNSAGAELPSTGGPGTSQIYILGVLLTGLAGIGLVMRKRRKTT